MTHTSFMRRDEYDDAFDDEKCGEEEDDDDDNDDDEGFFPNVIIACWIVSTRMVQRNTFPSWQEIQDSSGS